MPCWLIDWLTDWLIDWLADKTDTELLQPSHMDAEGS